MPSRQRLCGVAVDHQAADHTGPQKGVQRTSRAVVVSEAVLTGGVGAELSARIGEECFDYLEDPVVRIAGEDIPIPVSPDLESASIPTAGLIADTAKRMLRR